MCNVIILTGHNVQCEQVSGRGKKAGEATSEIPAQSILLVAGRCSDFCNCKTFVDKLPK